MVHSDAIYNDILELQRQFWKKVYKACILTVFETSSYFREKKGNNGFKACILTQLKRFGNADFFGIWKTMYLKHAF